MLAVAVIDTSVYVGGRHVTPSGRALCAATLLRVRPPQLADAASCRPNKPASVVVLVATLGASLRT